MHASVQNALAPVRRRQQLAFTMRAAVYGLLAGGVAGIGFAVAQWFTSGTVSAWVAAVVAAGLVLGLLVGLVWRRSWHDAAAAVDAHYQLKDRSTTALEFVAKTDAGDLHRLQIGDALQHLTRVEPKAVAPIRSPRALPYAIGVLAIAAVLPFVLPRTQEVNAGPRDPLPQVVAEAERLQERLSELEEVAKQEDNKDLKELVEKLKAKAEELIQPNVDEKEALAKLSEMQTAIQSQMAQFNVALVDGQLSSLGAALTSSAATEGAGKALQDNKLDKAAQELEKLEDPNLDRKEQKALEEKLKEVSKAMGDVGLGQLSAAVSDLAESIKGGNKSKISKATKVLAKEVNNQAKRKKINDLLARELDNLNESKCECQSNSLVTGKKPQKSTSPSSTFGMTTSGNVEGEKTKLLSQRNQVDLTGTPGEGPSDVETTTSPEARQQAGRAVKQVDYDKYRKLSEAVLESEAIPLGQRQMIRKYFELIRPQNADLADKPAEAKKEPATGAEKK
jgi:hypothetical protein